MDWISLLAVDFIPLDPPPPALISWPATVISAHQLVASKYKDYLATLKLDDGNLGRYKSLYHSIETDLVPLWLQLEGSGVGDGMLEEGLECLAQLFVAFDQSIAQLQDEQNGVMTNSTFAVVKKQVEGRGGRRTIIDPDILREALSPGRTINISLLAKALGVSRPTIYSNMRQYGITRAYSKLSDRELDAVVANYKELRPASGLRFMMAYLRTSSLRVQRSRVHQSLKRVDGVGSKLRKRKAVKRREYSVPGPNCLWHLDGHHKLIRWGIVVHGMIDGYD
ncbi:hypothetical protein FS749_000974 [Ceratobasidium sp. UAMH 11750]|nr:hypothetical protein FS749_000974 [Ceratobasidium sp. UAMH 11750]